jgi:hypothetical protein
VVSVHCTGDLECLSIFAHSDRAADDSLESRGNNPFVIKWQTAKLSANGNAVEKYHFDSFRAWLNRCHIDSLSHCRRKAICFARQKFSTKEKQGAYFRLTIQESTEKIPAPPRMKDSKPAIYNKTTS